MSETATGLQSDLVKDIRRLRREARLATVVLDDDPTGSQTVYDVNVALSMADLDLTNTFGTERRAFVLTNTRSMHTADAELTTRHAVDNAYHALAPGETLQVISRSDSTLRGHVHAEVGVLQDARRRRTGRAYDAVVFAPAFPEVGRTTLHGNHMVATPNGDVPVGETEYAGDAAFGYRSSSLPDFLIETSGGQLARLDIVTLDLDDLRGGGPERVRQLLAGASGRWVVVDALDPHDLEILALGITLATAAGVESLIRSGPSLVRPLLGVSGTRLYRPRLSETDPQSASGLVIVGSHTDRTNTQVARLRAGRAIVTVELSVPAVLAGDTDEVTRTAQMLADALRSGPALLMTSRDVIGRDSAEESLRVAREVSAAVARTVRRLLRTATPRWVICKGGITSHDVTVSGLGVERAVVLGQLFPGQVSVFRQLPGEAGYPRDFVIFPGNVGAEDSLLHAADIMEGENPS